MKRKNGKTAALLRVVLCAAAGSVLIHGAYRYADFKIHPEHYEAWSAPWYTGLLLHAVVVGAAAVIAAACLAAMRRLRRKDR